MWGDGLQTRSFTFIDDCVEGILRITKSDFKEPLNLGSSEMVREDLAWHASSGDKDRKPTTHSIDPSMLLTLCICAPSACAVLKQTPELCR